MGRSFGEKIRDEIDLSGPPSRNKQAESLRLRKSMIHRDKRRQRLEAERLAQEIGEDE